MYQLTPQPPRIKNINEYIIDYKLNRNTESLQFYLHFFEPRLNNITLGFCYRYSIVQRFQEIKQHIIESMLDKLPTYNTEIGATLEQYTERHIEDSVREFIHENGSMYKLGKSKNEYKALLKVNAIYYETDLHETKLTKDEKIEKIIKQTKFKKKKVINLLNQGADFRQFISFDKHIHVNDDDEAVCLSETVADYSGDPQRLYPKFVFERGFHKAIDELDDEERYLLVWPNDICSDCYSDLPNQMKKTYHDISSELFLYSESAVQKRIRKIELFMQRELIAGKVVEACVVRLVDVEKIEDGLIRYKYSYRDILKNGEGIIDNIYEPKTKTYWGADVIEFADGDNPQHYQFARLAINTINCPRNRKQIGMIDKVIVDILW